VADIFLSYAHEDVERARPLAQALTAEGWTVFWDRRIPPGRSFENYIEQQVRDSRVMLVLWSPDSVASQWVKIEASIGRGRNILVPVFIRPATIPFGYGHIHAADLTAWQPGLKTLEFEELLASIESFAPRTAAPPEVTKEAPRPANAGAAPPASTASSATSNATAIDDKTFDDVEDHNGEPTRVDGDRETELETSSEAATESWIERLRASGFVGVSILIVVAFVFIVFGPGRSVFERTVEEPTFDGRTFGGRSTPPSTSSVPKEPLPYASRPPIAVPVETRWEGTSPCTISIRNITEATEQHWLGQLTLVAVSGGLSLAITVAPDKYGMPRLKSGDDYESITGFFKIGGDVFPTNSYATTRKRGETHQGLIAHLGSGPAGFMTATNLLRFFRKVIFTVDNGPRPGESLEVSLPALPKPFEANCAPP
jgi:TIR domain